MASSERKVPPSSSSSDLLPPVHYPWIGPPPDAKTIGGGIPGHDVAGPKAMADASANPIYFYCLEQYKEHYVEQFKQYTGRIIVRTVEETVLASLVDGHVKDEAKMMATVMRVSLYAKDPPTTRDKVTVKNAFTLFLLLRTGGYTFDTNVLPSGKTAVALSAFPKFCVPNIINSASDANTFECWAMFSPPDYHAVARTIFKEFFSNWWKSQAIRKKEGVSKKYSTSQGSAIMAPLTAAVKAGRAAAWEGIFTGGANLTGVAIVGKLGIRKAYFNTHTFSKQGLYDKRDPSHVTSDSMFDWVYHGDSVSLESSIAHGANVHLRAQAVANGIYEGETPLHVAARRGHIDCVLILLEAGADSSVVAIYPNAQTSARELMDIAILEGVKKGTYLRTTYGERSLTLLDIAKKYRCAPSILSLIERAAIVMTLPRPFLNRKTKDVLLQHIQEAKNMETVRALPGQLAELDFVAGTLHDINKTYQSSSVLRQAKLVLLNKQINKAYEAFFQGGNSAVIIAELKASVTNMAKDIKEGYKSESRFVSLFRDSGLALKLEEALRQIEVNPYIPPEAETKAVERPKAR